MDIPTNQTNEAGYTKQMKHSTNDNPKDPIIYHNQAHPRLTPF